MNTKGIYPVLLCFLLKKREISVPLFNPFYLRFYFL